jgi:hypothetical protein
MKINISTKQLKTFYKTMREKYNMQELKAHQHHILKRNLSHKKVKMIYPLMLLTFGKEL